MFNKNHNDNIKSFDSYFILYFYIYIYIIKYTLYSKFFYINYINNIYLM